jgi:3-phosphoshikimate 1-carboxyvinyltransferase
MNAISDTVPTLAAIAPFASGPVIIRNIAHIRVKETDRIAAVATELRRMNVDVDELDDGLVIRPSTPAPATIQTYDDHRMAMSFAIAGTRAAGVTIKDIECTNKTYPNFFRDLETLRTL